MNVRPKDAAVYKIDSMQQVVMAAPVNGKESKAEHIAEKYGQQREEVSECITMRYFRFEHHVW